VQQTDAGHPGPDEIASDDVVDDGEALSFVAEDADAGQRLDVAITAVAKARDLVLSRTRIKALIEAGHLTIDDDAVLDAKRKVKVGDVIVLSVPPAEAPEPEGEPIPLVVVYEDEHLIVIDKPAGLVVHPAPGHATGTLVNALIAHCGDSLSGIGGVKRPGIVHRLDKDTSGLLVVAKTDAAHRGLAALFADHGRTLPLTRTYLAFVWARPERPFSTVDAPVGRHGTDRLRMAVVPEARGRVAITHWRHRESYGPRAAPLASLIACQLETGRTHQIRVHMAHIGHPVLGDPVYAKGFRSKTSRLSEATRASLDALGRQALHAAVLGFEHPVSGIEMEFESPMPADMQRLHEALQAEPA
jgi:23S rRNA pseudouridine1911/1915/1917 synthase